MKKLLYDVCVAYKTILLSATELFYKHHDRESVAMLKYYALLTLSLYEKYIIVVYFWQIYNFSLQK